MFPHFCLLPSRSSFCKIKRATSKRGRPLCVCFVGVDAHIDPARKCPVSGRESTGLAKASRRPRRSASRRLYVYRFCGNHPSMQRNAEDGVPYRQQKPYQSGGRMRTPLQSTHGNPLPQVKNRFFFRQPLPADGCAPGGDGKRQRLGVVHTVLFGCEKACQHGVPGTDG